MIRHPHYRSFKLVATVALATGIAGCGQGGIDDLQSYVAQIKQHKAPKPEPLPPIKPYNVYTYVPQDRDPFRPFFDQQEAQAEAASEGSGIKPDLNRNKEELEAFPLDSLRMVGTLQRDADIWAIVLASDDTVHRVQVGNYMGQNYGKIVNIQEDRVDLIEIARDARGRWQERPASIALVQEE